MLAGNSSKEHSKTVNLIRAIAPKTSLEDEIAVKQIKPRAVALLTARA